MREGVGEEEKGERGCERRGRGREAVRGGGKEREGERGCERWRVGEKG